ncbi:hypothetical protein CCACVL1_13867 [Corchorus capsularis]|uniref:Uncharacterized protein n=1 Tax=Corchorus capsularis TaxID=210143 RepID=A0A1R3I9I4_COCAP|nr:hypothetical protein CCACVL1_13867 [Corchorus capsularis]
MRTAFCNAWNLSKDLVRAKFNGDEASKARSSRILRVSQSTRRQLVFWVGGNRCKANLMSLAQSVKRGEAVGHGDGSIVDPLMWIIGAYFVEAGVHDRGKQQLVHTLSTPKEKLSLMRVEMEKVVNDYGWFGLNGKLRKSTKVRHSKSKELVVAEGGVNQGSTSTQGNCQLNFSILRICILLKILMGHYLLGFLVLLGGSSESSHGWAESLGRDLFNFTLSIGFGFQLAFMIV